MNENRLPLDTILQGNTLDILKTLPSDSIDTIITSPPYWGLRDYGEETNIIWGGDPNCEHEWGDELPKGGRRKRPQDYDPKYAKGLKENNPFSTGTGGQFCSKCGAWYGQLGLEPTLDLYIEHLLQITAELKRVLKPTGVMFWVHGDSYQSTAPGTWNVKPNIGSEGAKGNYRAKTHLPPKCMVMQNYRLILRMIDEQGWTLRNSIIWHKPNHMPSSVKDRFTNAYEPVFMLTKSKKYWFDLDAVRMPHKYPELPTKNKRPFRGGLGQEQKERGEQHPLGKNPGDVWAIPIQPFPEAHFATFPEKLVEPMIKASCPQWICRKCGKPRERIVNTIQPREQGGERNIGGRNDGYTTKIPSNCYAKKEFVGWTDCGCNAGWHPGVVLDPFAGSGTTLYVARKLGRYYIGIELNPEYVKMARKRLAKFGERLDKFVELEVKDGR